jgi:glycosyltransferase involved in cell wall biosynthesis
VEEAPGHPEVVVAVLTYRRPRDLAELLPLLQAQVASCDHAPAGVRAGVLVVDNDPAGSAADVVAGLGLASVRYVHEPVPGIAAARNRALDEAAGARLLLFIDDDERPVDGWLGLLLAAHARAGGCGVAGPVVSRFAVPLDPWVEAGAFFRRRRMPTGSAIGVAATNNLLLDLAAVRRAGLRFDTSLGLVGGSDTLFTRALVAAAGPLTWCDEAIVTDVVPAGRCTRRWVVRRQLRSGTSWSHTLLLGPATPGRRAVLRLQLTALGAARIGAGGTRLLAGAVLRDVRHRANGTRTAVRGLGMLLGAWGYVYAEYRRPAPAGVAGSAPAPRPVAP